MSNSGMFSVIGLALDLVGAVALVVGIFRPPRPTLTGWAYTPDDAARDAAFGNPQRPERPGG